MLASAPVSQYVTTTCPAPTVDADRRWCNEWASCQYSPRKTLYIAERAFFFLTRVVRVRTITAMLTTGTCTAGRTPLLTHLRTLSHYRGMCRDHGWASSALAALLSVGEVTHARPCRVCRGRGLACGWPPARCGVCGGLGIECEAENENTGL